MGFTEVAYQISQLCDGVIRVVPFVSAALAIYGVIKSKSKENTQDRGKWVVLLVASVVVLISIYWGENYVEVPSVVDCHYEDARQILLDSNLRYAGELKSGEKVKNQDPKQGEIVDRGTEVFLYGYKNTEPEDASKETEEIPGIETVPQKQYEVGDILCFGSFEQDNKAENGTEPIEWVVLAVENENILLLSRYALDSKCFHNRFESVYWENSSIRKWLNEEFLESAFDHEEQAQIMHATVEADPNPRFDTSSGFNTKDKVFLLSISEVMAYLPENLMFCIATRYAIGNNAYVNDETGGSWWLLRTMGESSRYVVSVNSDGTIDYDGGKVSSERGTIRPAMWVHLN
ncbi:MAG: PASTA domain-containing protein [Oscillospiraceae bacterium]|nr:PASTA domain-containing protein [Oscillospiraceae bacterium]